MSNDATETTDETTDEAAEPQELASDTRREAVADRLRHDIGDGLLEVDIEPNIDIWVRVDIEAWADAAAALAGRGFDFFVFLSGIDWMPSPWGLNEDDPFAEDTSDDDGDDESDESNDDDESDDDEKSDESDDDDENDDSNGQRAGRAGGSTRFQVFARFTNLEERLGITVKADVPDSLQVPSIIPTFAGANWHERETHEMFGFVFVGHPDLRKLYLPGDFEGYPLRKDFPLLSRHIKPWPGIVDVEPLPETDDEEGDGS